MKQMYSIGMYSTYNLTYKKLKDIFRAAENFERAVGALIDIALNDPEPIKITEETEVAAKSRMKNNVVIREGGFSGVHYWSISFSGIMEYWTANDDGEFFFGSDYNWKYTDDELKELRTLYDDFME